MVGRKWVIFYDSSISTTTPWKRYHMKPIILPCQGNLWGVSTKDYALTLTTVLYVHRTHLFGQGIIGPYLSNRVNKKKFTSLITNRSQSNQVIQNSHLDPWFRLMPNRSYAHPSLQMNFYWKLRMDCFASMQGFHPKEGLSWKKILNPLMIQTQNRSNGPQSYTSSFILGLWTFLSWSI